MMKCPLCNCDNLPGADTCSSCQADLADPNGPQLAVDLLADLTTGKLSTLIPKTPMEVDPSTPVRQVVQQLAKGGRKCALIVKDGRMQGIFTERDILQKVALEYDRVADNPVSTFMTPNPESLSREDTIAFGLNRMTAGGYRHLPIVEQDRPLGVVSVRDVMSYLAKRYPDELGTRT
ncbi:MAG: cyclic nucleotide-binding/CBS domain-containing protein [Phycisphaerae bacterium]